jgi:ABC-type antimicrobial peptide transport system, permease component
MFKNYLLVAIRNFRQERLYTCLNIATLALGLACIIVVGLWVRNEQNYDTHFHDADRIYRVECSLFTEGVPQPMIATDRRIAPTLRRYYSDVCAATAIYRTPTLLVSGNRTHFEENTFYADSAFFDVFSFQFVQGDAKTALRDSASVVLTEPMAKKLFGNKKAIGDTIWYSNNLTKEKMIPRIVTGVIKENAKTSHFHPALIFAKRKNMAVFEPVYIRLKGDYTAEYFKKYVWDQYYYKKVITPNYRNEKQDMRLDRLQSLTRIHLGGTLWEEFEPSGEQFLLYVFIAVSLLILILACINYVNLATARSFNRFREIAVRKVLGASRTDIVMQFLTEALLTSLVSLLFAFSVVEMVLPVFNDLADKQISLLNMDAPLFTVIVLLTVFMGLAAGAYPAFFVSSFQAIDVMKDMSGRRLGKVRLRRSLIIFQFSISTAMLLGTITIRQQLAYLKSRDLGIDTRHVLLVNLTDEKIYAQQDSIKHILQQHPDIEKVSATNNIPGGGLNHTYISFEQPNGMKAHLMNSMYVDRDFADVIRLQFLQGHNFDTSMKLDNDSAFVIINESAMHQLGYSNAVGKKIFGGVYYGSKRGRIVGVVKDFHATSLHNTITPMALTLGTLGRPEGRSKYLMLKLRDSSRMDSAVAFVKRTYMQYGQGAPFTYSFLEQRFNAQYRKEEKQMLLFNCFTAISLFTSLLGLIGLAAFFMKQRNKEISIRIISGASPRDIFFILSKDYTHLIIYAWLFACPATYVFMRQWLATFAYHISVGPGLFIAAGAIMLLVVWVAAAWQTWMTIRYMRPAEVLRYS